jgi:uncharacterized protein
MSLTGRVITWLMKLPPAGAPNVTIKRDVAVPLPDGVTLLADHYSPQTDRPCPTILVRSPYGRRGFIGAITALPYAERGYQVLVQSVRGTAGSGGEFAFARNEHADGLATIEWIKRQPWYNGQLAMLGPSYLGFAQWSVAADAGDDLKALVPSVTTSDFHHFRSQGGSMTLENMLDWSTMMTEQAATSFQLGLGSIQAMRRRGRNLETAYRSLPLDQADRVVINKPSPLYQEWFAHPTDDGYWRPIIYSDRVGEVTAPIALQAGWFDLFLGWQLQDYQRLRAAGRSPTLLIGPWYHTHMGSIPVMTRDALNFLDATLKSKAASRRAHPVRLYVMGANVWREFEDWPPPAQSLRWSLRPNGALTTTPPDATDTTEPDRYRYDPADPTPAVGGNSLGLPARMGQHDNRALEARPDVLVYTSRPLARDMEVIGPVNADLYVASSLDHTDFFVRLCVVEESGKSLNLCDSILRLTPENFAPDPDGVRHIQIALWPTAYRFRRGQRVRVQVSSGAHPRFARNTGTGEPQATATKLLVADQAVYHDPAHPSAITLPVLT